MIIWNGLGFLARGDRIHPVARPQNTSPSGCLRDDSYYQAHGWPKLLAFLIAAAMIWPLGIYLNRKRGESGLD